MDKRNFNDWLATFRESIATYDYYINFDKVYSNVDDIKIELNILNSLIGSKNIKEDFNILLIKYPEIIKAIPILLAKRENEIYCQDKNGGINYTFKLKKDLNKLDYSYFMEKTGLFNLLENHLVNNLVDYVTGVETGLDSNGRKNRGGHLMEDLVERYIIEAGFIKNENYFKEMYLKDVERKWNLDLSSLSNEGKTAKRFDFVVYSHETVYAIETNFYASNGSKLNETARSYKMLATEAANISGFKFVWFTDGIGWKSAKGNLRETFEVLETMYNIKDLEDNIIQKIF